MTRNLFGGFLLRRLLTDLRRGDLFGRYRYPLRSDKAIHQRFHKNLRHLRNLRDQNLPQKSVYIREICGTYSTPKGYLQRPNRSPPHKSVSNKYLFLRESLYFRFPFSFLFCKSCFSEESSFSRYSSSVISSSNISSSFVTSSSAISSSSVISFSFFPKSGSILR